MLTKQEAARIDELLEALLVNVSPTWLHRVDVPIGEAVQAARASLMHAVEGMRLPKHLAMAKATDKLPRCSHRMNLMDWSGEQLVPPCGCRLVEPG